MSYLDWDTSGTRLQRRRRYNLLDNVDSQASSSKPTVRSDGSALVVGDRWLDTSDRLWWFWDGTYWLSEGVFVAAIPQLTFTVGTQGNIFLPFTAYNVYFLDWRVGGLLNTPQNSTNYWSATLQRVSAGPSGSGTTTISSALNFSDISISSGFFVSNKNLTLNLHQDIAALSAGYYRISLATVGSPGSFLLLSALRYRLAKI